MTLLEAIRARFGQPKSPKFFLGAFGKHPGWDDHLDDLGLETDALLAAKHFIYNQGIGGVLDSGQWETYGDKALAGFDHLMVWVSDNELLAGRIWSSTDGKGRKRYPMILCAQIDNGGGLERLDWVTGLLSQWEADCRATEDAAEVRQVINDGKAFAALALAASDEDRKTPLSRHAFAGKIGLLPDSEATARVVYAVENYLPPFSRSNAEATKLAIDLKLAQTRIVPQHFRLRAAADLPEMSIEFWNDFLSPYLAPATPRLFLAPRKQPWVDVILGLPTPKHLICLKAKPQVLPLTCGIPYDVDAELQERAATAFRQFLDAPQDEPTRG